MFDSGFLIQVSKLTYKFWTIHKAIVEFDVYRPDLKSENISLETKLFTAHVICKPEQGLSQNRGRGGSNLEISPAYAICIHADGDRRGDA
jgi:hypothetical protein